MRSGYHNASETIRECPHKIKVKVAEHEYEWQGTWIKYRPEYYHGKLERCTLCRQKRVMDLTGDEVGYIEQASLFG